MSKYKVHREYEGWVTYEVEAKNEEAAKQKIKEEAENGELEKNREPVNNALGHTLVGTVTESAD